MILEMWGDDNFLFLFAIILSFLIIFSFLVAVSGSLEYQGMTTMIREMSCGELKEWILNEHKLLEFTKDRYVWMCEK